MLSRAWQCSANIVGDSTDNMKNYLVSRNAFKESKKAKLKQLRALLATTEWSEPSLIDHGKSICVHPTPDSLSVKVFNEVGELARMFAGRAEG